MIRLADQRTEQVMVLNWLTELRERLSAAGSSARAPQRPIKPPPMSRSDIILLRNFDPRGN